MTARSWIRNLFTPTPRIRRQTAARCRPALEALEDRVLPTLGTPVWLNAGPGPRILESAVAIPSQESAANGAVNNVAISPVNPNTLFAATVNGGIWESTTGGSQWTPVSDNAASLAISDIAFSPLDKNDAPVTASTPANQLVLYAGTGSTSSFSGQGGPAVGLLKSIDGGATWQPDGTNLPGEVVQNVVPTGQLGPSGKQVVLVGLANSGVWRSDDGGVTFGQISGSQNVDGKNTPSGLPGGFGVTNLLADPENNLPFSDKRFYVALDGGGIYRSDDAGLTWRRLDNGGNPIAGLTATTTLLNPVDSSGNMLLVRSPLGFPASAPFDIRVDSERMTVTAIVFQVNGTQTWTVVRGQRGTAVAAHNLNASVSLLANVRLAASVDTNSAPERTVLYAAFVRGGSPQLTSVYRSTNADTAPASLVSSVNTSANTLTVSSTTDFPASAGFQIQVDNEIMIVRSIVSDGEGTYTWTVDRSASIRAAHTAGTSIYLFAAAWKAMDMPGTTTTGSKPTSLFSSVNQSTTTLTVRSTADFPASAPFNIRVNNEQMTVTQMVPNSDGTQTWTVVRGQGGTAPADHNKDALVSLVPVFVGLNPVGQGMFNFSFTADPTNPNIVYIGGDAQPDIQMEAGGSPGGPFGSGNAVGATRYSGRLFRGNAAAPKGSQWTPITDSDAIDSQGNRTAPHADSRSLLVTPSGSLLETDDGGIYLRTNPQSKNGSWVSENGNLSDSEFIGVSYDDVNNVLFGGAQDNGTAVQSAYGDLRWRQLLGGDGGMTQVDTTSSPGKAIYYYTSQDLGGFRRETLDSSDRIVEPPTPLALRVTGQTVTNSDGTQRPATILDFNPGFYQLYVLNKVNPKRMLLGTTIDNPNSPFLGTTLFESVNQGDDFTMPNGTANMGFVTALAYGGFNGTQGVEDVAYVGTNGQSTSTSPLSVPMLYLRQIANGPFNAVPGYPGAAPRGIVLDPTNWKTAYVLDAAGQVWRTPDATAANPTWQNLTGNLPTTLKVTDLRTIEIIGSGANAGLFVGGQGGVYATDNAQPGATTWVRFGTGLPNVLVTGLSYDSKANVLAAGTLGRGAWLLSNASAFVNQPQTPNQPPVINLPSLSVTATVNDPAVFSGNTLISISDPDSGTGFERVSLSAVSGQFKLASTTGLSILRGNASGGAFLTFEGTLPNINAALNGLTYTPRNFTGNVLLNISVSDLGSSGTGNTLSADASQLVGVAQVNDRPVITVPGAQSVKTNRTDFPFQSALGNGITIADGDAGLNPLEMTLLVNQGTLRVNNASVTFEAGHNNAPAGNLTFVGTLANLNAALQSLVYTPPRGGSPRQATLTVFVNDLGGTGFGGSLNDQEQGSATVSINVTPNDEPPFIRRPTGPLTLGMSTPNFPSQLAFTGTNQVSIEDLNGSNTNVTVGLAVSAGELRFSNPEVTVNNVTFPSNPIAAYNAFLSTMVYVPPSGFQGPVTLKITVNDLGNTGPGGPQTTTALLTINVGTAIRPAAAVPRGQFANTGSATFSAARGNRITVSTNVPDSSNLEVTLSADHGTLTLPDPSALFFTVGAGLGDSFMTFSGSPAAINKALNGLVYVADPSFKGKDYLTVTVDDPEVVGDRTPQPTSVPEEDGGGDDGNSPPPSDPDVIFPNLPPVPLPVDTETVPIFVQEATTTTRVSVAVVGSTLVLAAAVSPSSGGAGTPTGFVTFSFQHFVVGLGYEPVQQTVPLQYGLAVLSLPDAGAGVLIRASYQGDDNFAGSSSGVPAVTPVNTSLTDLVQLATALGIRPPSGVLGHHGSLDAVLRPEVAAALGS